MCTGIDRPYIRLKSGLSAILWASRVTLGALTHDIRSAGAQCGHFGAPDAVRASTAGLKFHADLVFCATQIKRRGFLHVGGGYIFLDTSKPPSHLYVSLPVSSIHQRGMKSCNGHCSIATDCGQVLRLGASNAVALYAPLLAKIYSWCFKGAQKTAVPHRRWHQCLPLYAQR